MNILTWSAPTQHKSLKKFQLLVTLFLALTHGWQGKLPDSLERVKDERVSEFIGLCLAPASVRPSAADLLTHPFLSANDPADTTLKQPVDLCMELHVLLPV